MTDRHVALIVEDDDGTAKILKDVVASLGHASIHVTTREQALAEIAKKSFCYVLLDMQIPDLPDSIPLVTTGLTLLKKDLRGTFPARSEHDKRLMQIIVVTGYSEDTDFVTRVMQEGADDFIVKPFDADLTRVADKISNCLRHSGRSDHAACAQQTKAATGRGSVPPVVGVTAGDARGTGVRLSLDGVQAKRRTAITVEAKQVALQDAHFAFLLRLVVASQREPGAWSSRHDLGVGRTPETPSRLRQALAVAAPLGFEIVQSDHDGRCRLNPGVVVDAIDWASLKGHSDPMVQKVAAERDDAAKRGDALPEQSTKSNRRA